MRYTHKHTSSEMERGAVREIVVERGNEGGDKEDDIEDMARREREGGGMGRSNGGQGRRDVGKGRERGRGWRGWRGREHAQESELR